MVPASQFLRDAESSFKLAMYVFIVIEKLLGDTSFVLTMITDTTNCRLSIGDRIWYP